MSLSLAGTDSSKLEGVSAVLSGDVLDGAMARGLFEREKEKGKLRPALR